MDSVTDKNSELEKVIEELVMASSLLYYFAD